MLYARWKLLQGAARVQLELSEPPRATKRFGAFALVAAEGAVACMPEPSTNATAPQEPRIQSWRLFADRDTGGQP